jgi:two-component system, LuxR family, sensor kinase FixL
MNDMNLKTALERLQTLEMELTEREQLEVQLRESENKFRLLVESASDWIWEVDYNGIYTYVSPQVEALLGYKPQEVVGESPFVFMPPEEAKKLSNIFQKLLDKRAPISALENINICKDGTLKILETNGIAFFDENGEFSGYRGIDRDITGRKLSEQALHESEEKFKSITDTAQDAIIMMDDEGKITYWNGAAEKIFGYKTEEVMGKLLHGLLTHERFFAAQKIGFSHFKETGEGSAVGKTLELSALRKDGSEFPVELSLSALRKDGTWNAIGIVRDITERKEMEKELKLKEQMMLAQSKQAAMGDMISMIAHQWRQPLAAMSMYVNNVQASLELDGKVSDEELNLCAHSVSEQIQHLSKTIDNFRNFFKPDQSKEKTTIEDVLNSTQNIIGSSLKNNNILLNIQNASKSSLFINKSSLVQVLLNIIGNAKDILLEKEIMQATININVNETKEAITISICDNGGGIPESIIDKIGQPYFTTKQELNGTGLGLYTSKTIAEKHLFGTLTWHNEEKGACFVITLNIQS